MNKTFSPNLQDKINFLKDNLLHKQEEFNNNNIHHSKIRIVEEFNNKNIHHSKIRIEIEEIKVKIQVLLWKILKAEKANVKL